MTRSLGLDIGDKRIGVALSDPARILASPLTVIEREDEGRDIAAVIDIIGRHQVGKIIVGLPRSLDGGLGGQAEKVQAFTRRLCSSVEIPVEYRDERLTTVSARRLMRDTKRGKYREKARDDAIAAHVYIHSASCLSTLGDGPDNSCRPSDDIATGKYTLAAGSHGFTIHLNDVSSPKLYFELFWNVGGLSNTGYDVIEFHDEFAACNGYRSSSAASVGFIQFHPYAFKFKDPIFFRAYLVG